MYGPVACLLMVALASRPAAGTPVGAFGGRQSGHAQCTAGARDLLAALRRVLEQPERLGHNTLFHGFNCSDLAAAVNPDTQTASVCQPTRDAKCSDRRTSPFSATECLQNIANDLDRHRSMLTQYVSGLDHKANSESVKELGAVTESTRSLQQSCDMLPKPQSSKYSWIPSSSFENRKELCKQLKGFHVRTITINRALGFICAGEHKK